MAVPQLIRYGKTGCRDKGCASWNDESLGESREWTHDSGVKSITCATSRDLRDILGSMMLRGVSNTVKHSSTSNSI
jgi:hypothetical protein